jgi:hypothetical protein
MPTATKKGGKKAPAARKPAAKKTSKAKAPTPPPVEEEEVEDDGPAAADVDDLQALAAELNKVCKLEPPLETDLDDADELTQAINDLMEDDVLEPEDKLSSDSITTLGLLGHDVAQAAAKAPSKGKAKNEPKEPKAPKAPKVKKLSRPVLVFNAIKSEGPASRDDIVVAANEAGMEQGSADNIKQTDHVFACHIELLVHVGAVTVEDGKYSAN